MCVADSSFASSACLCVCLLAVALTIASPRFVPRPELFSFVFLAAYLWLLERVPPGRHIYLLVPLQVLWVNSHALFVTGLVLIGCYWLGATLAFLLARTVMRKREIELVRAIEYPDLVLTTAR